MSDRRKEFHEEFRQLVGDEHIAKMRARDAEKMWVSIFMQRSAMVVIALAISIVLTERELSKEVANTLQLFVFISCLIYWSGKAGEWIIVDFWRGSKDE